jgi:hypothetical protein
MVGQIGRKVLQSIGWAARSAIEPTWPMIFGGFLLTGTYFVAASMIFPADPQTDHEQHFAENYRLVLGGFLACNIAINGWIVYQVGIENFLSWRQIIVGWSLIPVTLLAIVIPDRRVVLACICWLIMLYPLSLAWG